MNYSVVVPGTLPGDVVTVLHTGTSPFSKEKIQVRLVLTSSSIQFWKKAKKKLIGESSLALCWTESEIQLGKKVKENEAHFRFGVIFPSQRWPIVVKSEAERTKLLQKIHDAIKITLKKDIVPAGTSRKGTFFDSARRSVVCGLE